MILVISVIFRFLKERKLGGISSMALTLTFGICINQNKESVK